MAMDTESLPWWVWAKRGNNNLKLCKHIFCSIKEDEALQESSAPTLSALPIDSFSILRLSILPVFNLTVENISSDRCCFP